MGTQEQFSPRQVLTDHQIAVVMEARENLGRNFMAPDLQGRADLWNIAEAYARGWDNPASAVRDFMASMKEALDRYTKLLDTQAKGVLNILYNEARMEIQTAVRHTPDALGNTGVDLTWDNRPPKIVTGLFEVTVRGGRAQIKVEPSRFKDTDPGTLLISYLGDDGKPHGFAFSKGHTVNLWGRYKGDDRLLEVKEVLEQGAATVVRKEDRTPKKVKVKVDFRQMKDAAWSEHFLDDDAPNPNDMTTKEIVARYGQTTDKAYKALTPEEEF